jgi:hypothetical protein
MLRVNKAPERCEDECCTPPPLILSSRPTADRLLLVRKAFRLEWITIGWMIIETVVAIGSGILSGSLVLLAFGLDSVIELISAGMLMWRLSVELRHGQVSSENAERIAGRVGGALLFALAAYVVVGGARCVSSARRALHGGRLATAVPTVTIGGFVKSWHVRRERAMVKV